MDDKTRDKLLKCLALTTSDSDGEALAAIRMANRLRAKLGLSWEQLLSGGGVSSSTQRGGYDYQRDMRDAWEHMQAAARRAQEQARTNARAQQQSHAEWQARQQRENAYRQQRRRNSGASAQQDFGNQKYEAPNWDEIFKT